MMRNLKLALALTTTLTAVAASADIPSDLDDLVGVRASSGENEMKQRGYTYVDYGRMENATWSYWWNDSRKACVGVVTSNGRYERIASVSAGDCNQYVSSNHDDNDAGAAIAIGAAALIGALVVAHKSHHHDEEQHKNTVDAEAEFERGYRDGQYNHSFNDYNNSTDYEQGYDAGVDERRHGSSYQHHNPGQHNPHGYTSSVSYDDLIGARGSSADTAMNGRGFRNVDGFKERSTSYTIWWNRQTRQCLQMAVSDGRVEGILDIGANPACH